MSRIRHFNAVAIAISLSLNVFAASHPEAAKVVKEYCYDCHDSEAKKGDLNLEAIVGKDLTGNSDSWEKVIRKMESRQMPPIGKRRPDEQGYNETIAELTATLDKAAAKHPNP